MENKLRSIEADIQNGLKYKSADRLRNLINEHPNEQKLWNRLAELYYDSGFLDSAGKYWILTEPTDERIKKCVEIYEKSVNYSGYQILQEITFRGDKTKLSKYAQKKLAELESDSKEKTNHIPEFKPKVNKPKKQNKKYVQTFKDKLGGYVIFGIVAVIVVLIIIGFVSVIKWIF
ncbi:DUF6584 family protein [Patiriisocius hiemis]|uniref:Uncharacterized protein n=1 Tax=Patiriisocius hiemis TaxID=3075604 RepID=A0ABU2YBL6_9FLAO|nr:DUF6584 family protein [Constantimarinum sp. W242]MDT0554620.1 hypothetical protein [Constantimarinum sp. W242]